ncbi:hypothetical protein [Brucella anthropi]|uniref:hypothetical protein n=1 Tax=Brucella anthropi TaxID=529 RepID=UPI00125D7EF6|nr:hypothetical protein [Brucella anthropi]QFP61910.1 hypothetical protein FT787_01695 [Brucella anthropi]
MIQFQHKNTPTCTSSVENRLADKMREMAFAGENVTPETLESRGFSREVVTKLGQRAAALALRRSIKRIDSHA